VPPSSLRKLNVNAGVMRDFGGSNDVEWGALTVGARLIYHVTPVAPVIGSSLVFTFVCLHICGS